MGIPTIIERLRNLEKVFKYNEPVPDKRYMAEVLYYAANDIEGLREQVAAMVEGLELENDAINGAPEALKMTCQVVALAAKKYDPMKAKLAAVGKLPQHEVLKDDFSHEYVVVSCGVRNSSLIEIEAFAITDTWSMQIQYKPSWRVSDV